MYLEPGTYIHGQCSMRADKQSRCKLLEARSFHFVGAVYLSRRWFLCCMFVYFLWNQNELRYSFAEHQNIIWSSNWWSLVSKHDPTSTFILFWSWQNLRILRGNLHLRLELNSTSSLVFGIWYLVFGIWSWNVLVVSSSYQVVVHINLRDQVLLNMEKDRLAGERTFGYQERRLKPGEGMPLIQLCRAGNEVVPQLHFTTADSSIST